MKTTQKTCRTSKVSGSSCHHQAAQRTHSEPRACLRIESEWMATEMAHVTDIADLGWKPPINLLPEPEAYKGRVEMWGQLHEPAAIDAFITELMLASAHAKRQARNGGGS